MGNISDPAWTRNDLFSWTLLISVGLLGVAWNPVSNSPGVDGKFLALYLTGGLAALYLATAAVQNRLSIESDRTELLLIAAYIGGASISTLLAWSSIALVGTAAHREGLLTFFLYAVVFLTFAERRNKLRVADIAPLFSLAILIGLGLGFTGSEVERAASFGRRFVGSFAEPSFLAGFLVLAIPLVAYSALRSGSKPIKILSMAALIAAHYQLFLSGSRTGYFAWFISSALLVLLLVREAAPGMKRRLYILAGSLLVLPLVTSRFSFASLAEGIGGRVTTWRPIWITGQYILVGAGPDRMRPATYNRYALFGAHNSFINDIVQIGWIAALAALGLALWILLRLGRRVWLAKAGSVTFEPWLAASILGYLVFMMGNYTRPYVNMIFWILLALAAKAAPSSRERLMPALKWPVAAVGICLVLASGFVGTRSAIASYHYWVHLNVDMSQPILQAWQPLEKAISYEPHSELFHEARGGMALRLIDMGVQDVPGVIEIRSAAVEDWEFLVTEVYNNRRVYEVLAQAYTQAKIPPSTWLPRPTE